MIGNAIQEIKKEIVKLAAMVSESALKNAPVTPDRNASGAKMIIVAADEPMNGGVNSAAASSTAPLGGWVLFSLTRRTMCSAITIVSSIISPTAAASPPRVIIL